MPTAALLAAVLPAVITTSAAAASKHPGAPKATASAGCQAHSTPSPGVTTRQLMSDGLERTYELDIPYNYTGKKPFAIVLALHPLSITYQYMPSVVRFDVNTATYDFIGVAPSGLLSAGAPYWYAAPTAQNYDVDFISNLVAHLEATMCVNTKEVFSTGISNGAQMSSLLGCRLAGTITAISPVEGEEYLTPCTGKPEPILAFHGTADPILPYDGGGLNATKIADLYYWHGDPPPGMPAPMGIDESMQDWAVHNGCRPHATTVRISSQVQKRTWAGCKAATVLYIVDGGGHGWPGQPVRAMEKTFGPETTQIDATNLMMTFFFSHQRKGADRPRSAA
ncbi:MAG: alpha/beta hydrolase family esterase [Acidimicrobiales bacterium]